VASHADKPDIGEAKAAADRAVKDITRTSEIISRVRSLFENDDQQREPLISRSIIASHGARILPRMLGIAVPDIVSNDLAALHDEHRAGHLRDIRERIAGDSN
jgi:hypothetical protein